MSDLEEALMIREHNVRIVFLNMWVHLITVSIISIGIRRLVFLIK